MKKKLLSTLMVFLSVFSVNATNQNIANFIPSSSDWNAIFPNKHVLYSYNNFIDAVDELSDYKVTYKSSGNFTSVTVERKNSGTSHSFIITSSSWSGPAVTVDFKDFCNTGDNYNDKRELAAFFGNISQETTGGWKPIGSGLYGAYENWGLSAIQENGMSCTSYKTYNGDYPAANNACYYGRGPIQISWNYNYGRFSDFLYGDTRLLTNPNEVHTNGVTSFKSAIWFWMTPQCPKPSCHQVMQEKFDETEGTYAQQKMKKKGFLHTVNIINGGVECRSTGNLEKVERRSGLYGAYMKKLGFSSAEVSNEDSGDYSTICASYLSGVMTNYTACAFKNKDISNCSSPSLGGDQSFCTASITIDAGVTLKTGESIAWFKDNNLIGSANGTTYVVNSAGTFKVIVTGNDCAEEDEVIISSGGSLIVTGSNDNNFCGGGGEGSNETTISVSGGNGYYHLYDLDTGGSPLKSGSEFTFNSLDVNAGSSKTFYLDEPAGTIYTVGPTERWTVNPNAWNGYSAPVDIRDQFTWMDNRFVFTTAQELTLNSIDFDIAKGTGNALLTVEIYSINDIVNPIKTKTIDLEAIDYQNWDQEIYTASLNFELPAGQYAIDFSKSTCLLQMAMWTNASGNNFDFLSWGESGVVAFDGANNRPNAALWGLFTNYICGAYNWKFSTGGSGSSCGRTPIAISNSCPNTSEELSLGSFYVYPNPAQDIINISLNGIIADGAVIELFNQVGQVVISKTLNGNSNIAQIQTDELDSGVYFVKVTSGNDAYNSNVVITK